MKRIEGLEGLNHKSDEVCLTCPLAKFTKLPYTQSQSRASQIMELIHIDVWGPYRVATRNNHRFFLTIVDDHSRTTWVHLLKYKSDSFSAIKSFVKMAETQ